MLTVLYISAGTLCQIHMQTRRHVPKCRRPVSPFHPCHLGVFIKKSTQHCSCLCFCLTHLTPVTLTVRWIGHGGAFCCGFLVVRAACCTFTHASVTSFCGGCVYCVLFFANIWKHSNCAGIWNVLLLRPELPNTRVWEMEPQNAVYVHVALQDYQFSDIFT